MERFRFIDAHVHTAFSTGDCKEPMESYLALLRNGTARGVGFADHIHPITESFKQTYPGYEPKIFDDRGYDALIHAAREEGLRVYKGIEVSYEWEYDQICRERVEQSEYDYVIGSAHSYGGLWVTRTYWQNLVPGTAFREIVQQYHAALIDTLQADWLDVVGHIGVYKRFLPDNDLLIRCAQDVIRECEDEAARACAQSGKIVEVNTSGLTAPGGRTMPDAFFLERFRHYGGDRVCLSSDAHAVEKLNQKFDEAAGMLKNLGFTHLTYPWAPEEKELL
ncbi:MAG: hypothetical protein IJP30_00600 [Clostridia bacterium]|nr:hypothetical protein [Clostridia bacterium]